jgi:hypothetical protein
VQTMAELQANFLPGRHKLCDNCVTAVPKPYEPWQHYVQTIAELQAESSQVCCIAIVIKWLFEC